VRDVIGQDVWVKSLEQRLARIPEWMPGVVITDVRFPNEADMLTRRGGLVFRVERCPDSPDAPPTAGGRTGNHPSETALDGWDGWAGAIANDRSREELWSRVNELMDRLKARAP
jgi:hypothetical protein